MENRQHIKAYNTNTNSKKRIKYLSTKKRAKAASADVYRSYSSNKRRWTSTREEAVHAPDVYAHATKNGHDNNSNNDDNEQKDGTKKKKKKRRVAREDQDGMTVIVQDHQPYNNNNNIEEEEEEEEIDAFSTESTFASELDLSKDRNASKLFTQLYKQVSPLVASLPEILHHSSTIVTILLNYLLSPNEYDASGFSTEQQWRNLNHSTSTNTSTVLVVRPRFYVNLVTMDVLHLLSVLARELRHEIHPFLHSDILPRIVFDLINPPTATSAATISTISTSTVTASTNKEQSTSTPISKIKPKEKQHTQDISIIETSFRTISYIFRYAATPLLSETKGTLDKLRMYYGATLAHRAIHVRRMGSETFAPLIRKMTVELRNRHVKRVLKSLIASAVTKEENEEEEESPSLIKSRKDGIDGIALLLFQIVRGVKGVLHSKSQPLLSLIFHSLVTTSLIGRRREVVAASTTTATSSAVLLERKKGKILCDIVSSFLYKIRGHASSEDQFTIVWKELYQACDLSVNTVIESLDKRKDNNNKSNNNDDGDISSSSSSSCYMDGIGYILQVITGCIQFRNGILLATDQYGCNHMEYLSNLLHLLLDKVYSYASVDNQVSILQFTCAVYKVYPSHDAFESCLHRFLPCISISVEDRLQESANDHGGGSSGKDVSISTALTGNSSTGVDPIMILVNDLLPHVSRQLASQALVPNILNIVAHRSETRSRNQSTVASTASTATTTTTEAATTSSALRIIHILSTTKCIKNDKDNMQQNHYQEDNEDHDHLFEGGAYFECSIPFDTKKTLIQLCCLEHVPNLNKVKMIREECARVGYVSRCIPFLMSIQSDMSGGDGSENDGSDDSENDDNGSSKDADLSFVTDICSWVSNVIKTLESKATGGKSGSDSNTYEEDINVAMGLLLESLAECTLLQCQDQSSKTFKTLWKTIKKLKKSANKLLKRSPTNIFVVKACAAFATVLDQIKKELFHENVNEMFDLLHSNLSSCCHFLRLHSLKILSFYPMIPFVTDYADLDLSGDLDEEADGMTVEGSTSNGGGGGGTTPYSGMCDLIETLLRIEETPVNIDTERNLTSSITRVEIMARTGRLPVMYVEAAVHHMFGILHTKFQPLWQSSTKAIVALASSHRDLAWPCIESQLERVMIHSESITSSSFDTATTTEVDMEKDSAFMLQHHVACLAWNKSSGKNAQLFEKQLIDAQNHGRVSRHQTTDELTIFELVCNVLEGIPHLIVSNSKQFVSVFVSFLHHQYFQFYNNDPDSREIGLDGNELCMDKYRWASDQLGRKFLQRKLTSLLKVLSEVKGIHQMHQHQLLSVILVSFLSHSDTSIARLSLKCVMGYNRYKPLSTCVDRLRAMLEKVKLRDTLTNFNIAKKNGEVEESNRQQLIPIIIRILFGRFAVRGGGGGNKSSKDSPAVRRAAILSFLNALDHNSGELDYFIYMMVRVFIPSSEDMYLGDCGHHDMSHMRKMINATSNILSTDEMSNIPYQRQMGFLNLLSDVVKQFGYGVEEFIPIFVELLVGILGTTEKFRASISQEDVTTRKFSLNDDNEDDVNDNTPPNEAIGKIRNMSFRRISELLLQFETSYDFLPHAEKLWSVIAPSLEYLPSSTNSAEKVPSLLHLLESISSSPKLLPLLAHHQDAAKVVFECISLADRYQVVESVLNFLENLLTEGGTVEITNIKDLLENNTEGKKKVGISLLLRYLDVLIEQFMKRLQNKGGSNNLSSKDPRAQKIASRELSILCQVSELMLASKLGNSDATVNIMEKLCELLVPYLSVEKKDFDSSMMDVLGILISIFPKVNKDAALSYVHDLSKLLGTNKSNPGISSLQMRRKIATCIESATTCVQDEATPMVGALKSLCASDTRFIEEYDFDEVLPVINDLGSSDISRKNWNFYLNGGNTESPETDYTTMQIKLLSPLIFTCLHLLHDSDGVLSRSAFQALKSLILIASEDWKRRTEDSMQTERFMLEKMIESSLLPAIKSGLRCYKVDIQRSFILLLSEVSRNFSSNDSQNLYGDLSILIRDDDQDLDFFLNFTHVQIHRKAKSLKRLRKLLNDSNTNEEGEGDGSNHCQFSVQTLSNVLLPLCMHPIINENKVSKGDGEAVLTEAIATVGAIAQHLSWRKYQNIILTVLSVLHRSEDNERFIVATLCSIIDGFHFESDLQIESSNTSEDEENTDETFVQSSLFKQLTNTIIPRIESCLVKEMLEKGEKIKRLRCPIVLALVKLVQKLPNNILEAKLPRLLGVICDALKHRESNERDAARTIMSKIATICEKYLSDIIRELAITLKEGYQLHVRAATVHSILVALNEKHKDLAQHEYAPLDTCVPGMMDIIQQDIFGSADEMKKAESVKKRLVKEASGNKSYNSLELISRNIFFDPSNPNAQPTANKLGNISPVHAVVTPLLERLRDPDVDTITIRKVKECLNRIVAGITRNPSTDVVKLLPFVHAIISPIIVVNDEESDHASDSDETDDEDDKLNNITVTTSKTSNKTRKDKEAKQGHVRKVVEWKVSQLNNPRDERAARQMKMKEKLELRKVIDGVNAPKMTGSSRVKILKASDRDLNDPASTTAILFGLSLLHSFLKRCKVGERSNTIADPFVEILTNCIKYSKDTNMTLLSLRSMQVLLRLNLPSVPQYNKKLGKSILKLLTLSGNTHNETTSVLFKTLSILMYSSSSDEQGEKSEPSLNDVQMPILISIIQSALTDSEHHNATFSLIKAVTSTGYTSVEFYDLMETIINTSVMNQQATIRQQASQIFMQYLIEYPMGKQRVEKHLKQMVLNIKYEYEEGRLSALGLVNTAIKKLPLDLLVEYVELMFLPLVLQLANDESAKCREAVSDCIESLLMRLGTQELQTLYEYATKWSQISDDGNQTRHLRRTSIQLFGIFTKTRSDFMKRGDAFNELLDYYEKCLSRETQYIDHSGDFEQREWEMSYFCLQGMEKMIPQIPAQLWAKVIEMLVFPHSWVQLTASRLISSHLSSINVHTFNSDNKKLQSFLLSPGTLYDIARNLCFQLNTDDDKQMKDISTYAIKNLTWVLIAMDRNPSICFKSDMKKDEIDDDNSDNGDQVVDSTPTKNPARWLMVRLSNIAKKKGYLRREVVFKCFAAFATACEADLITQHLQLMLEPLNRAVYQVEQKENCRRIYNTSNFNDSTNPEAEIPKDVMQLLEDKCGTEVFVNALAAVKSRAIEKRLKRKQEYASEAVHDPASFAKRKIMKQQKTRHRKKQKVEERKRLRGVLN